MLNHKHLNAYLLATAVTLALINPTLTFSMRKTQNEGAEVIFESTISSENVPEKNEIEQGTLINHEMDPSKCLLYITRWMPQIYYTCIFTYEVKSFEKVNGKTIKAGEIDLNDSYWGMVVDKETQTQEMMDCVKNFQKDKEKKEDMKFLDVIAACPSVLQAFVNPWEIPVGCSNPQATAENGMVKDSTIYVRMPQFIPKNRIILI